MRPEINDRELNSAFKRLGEAKAAGGVLQLFEAELVGRQRQLDIDLFKRIESGVVISSEEALQFVFKKHAHWSFMNSLEQKLRGGESAARQLTPIFEEEEQYGT